MMWLQNSKTIDSRSKGCNNGRQNTLILSFFLSTLLCFVYLTMCKWLMNEVQWNLFKKMGAAFSDILRHERFLNTDLVDTYCQLEQTYHLSRDVIANNMAFWQVLTRTSLCSLVLSPSPIPVKGCESPGVKQFGSRSGQTVCRTKKSKLFAKVSADDKGHR